MPVPSYLQLKALNSQRILLSKRHWTCHVGRSIPFNLLRNIERQIYYQLSLEITKLFICFKLYHLIASIIFRKSNVCRFNSLLVLLKQSLPLALLQNHKIPRLWKAGFADTLPLAILGLILILVWLQLLPFYKAYFRYPFTCKNSESNISQGLTYIHTGQRQSRNNTRLNLFFCMAVDVSQFRGIPWYSVSHNYRRPFLT